MRDVLRSILKVSVDFSSYSSSDKRTVKMWLCFMHMYGEFVPTGQDVSVDRIVSSMAREIMADPYHWEEALYTVLTVGDDITWETIGIYLAVCGHCAQGCPWLVSKIESVFMSFYTKRLAKWVSDHGGMAGIGDKVQEHPERSKEDTIESNAGRQVPERKVLKNMLWDAFSTGVWNFLRKL